MEIIVLLAINLILIGFVFVCSKKKQSNINMQSVFKHICLLEASWTGFLFLLGLFFFFDIMEASHDGKSFLEIASRETLIQLSILIGFGIIHLSIFVAIVIKLLKKRDV
jgi:hypothetical protein